jgi:hypothetical protein
VRNITTGGKEQAVWVQGRNPAEDRATPLERSVSEPMRRIIVRRRIIRPTSIVGTNDTKGEV